MGITVAVSQQCVHAVKVAARVLGYIHKSRTSRPMAVTALFAWHLQTASCREHGATLFSCVAGGQGPTDVY